LSDPNLETYFQSIDHLIKVECEDENDLLLYFDKEAWLHCFTETPDGPGAVTQIIVSFNCDYSSNEGRMAIECHSHGDSLIRAARELLHHHNCRDPGISNPNVPRERAVLYLAANAWCLRVPND